MNKLGLISHAESFISFILPKLKNIYIKDIILFGSVARGDFNEKSDIDIFIDTNEESVNSINKIIKKEQKRFLKSTYAKIGNYKGIKNEIKTHVGVLDEWKLKQSIISDGIILYGKYKHLEKGMEQYNLFIFKPIKNVTKRNRVIRKLLGRYEKKKKSKGLLQMLNGRSLTPRSFIIPIQYSDKIIKLFSKEKINYKLFEIWSNQFKKF